MKKCDLCKKEIIPWETFIGPPFVDEIRHMKCPPMCKKCGFKFINETQFALHRLDCK